jgi:hypothetical protein
LPPISSERSESCFGFKLKLGKIATLLRLTAVNHGVDLGQMYEDSVQSEPVGKMSETAEVDLTWIPEYLVTEEMLLLPGYETSDQVRVLILHKNAAPEMKLLNVTMQSLLYDLGLSRDRFLAEVEKGVIKINCI